MVKKYLKKIMLPFYQYGYLVKWRIYLKKNNLVRLVIGSGGISTKGWFGTDILVLDITKKKHFERFFSKHRISYVLAEHVLEYLTTGQIETMLHHLWNYSTPDVNIRIAVPDGYHEDSDYIEKVKPGGTGPGADDHKHLFTYQTLTNLFSKASFKAELKEYWDEQGQFHSTYQNDEKGIIRRSYLNDTRNVGGKRHYTSLIIDFTKLESGTLKKQ